MEALISTTDIAARFGVSVAAVSNWRSRHGKGTADPFPQPDEGGRRARWRSDRWAEIESWRVRQGSGTSGPKSATAVSRAPREREGYLSDPDVAGLLGVSRSAVRAWLGSGLELAFPEPDDIEKYPSGIRKRWWQDSRRDELVAWHEQYLAQQADDVRHRRRSTRTPGERGGRSELAALNAIAQQFFAAAALPALQALATLHGSGATAELNDDLRQVANDAAELAHVLATLQSDHDMETSDRVSQMFRNVVRSKHTSKNGQLKQVAYLLSQMTPTDFVRRLTQSAGDTEKTASGS